jgi:hypothetical protein
MPLDPKEELQFYPIKRFVSGASGPASLKVCNALL